MASTRLRRAFSYPDSDSDEDGSARPEMDDQEQDALIQALRTQNEQRDLRYKLILTIIPLACSVGYLPSLLSATAGTWNRIISILTIASLILTAYSAREIPLMRLSTESKVPVRHLTSNVVLKLKENVRTVNSVVCATLAVASFILRDSPNWRNSFSPSLLLVPGVVLLATWVVERSIKSVDIDGLENLRYEFKGA